MIGGLFSSGRDERGAVVIFVLELPQIGSECGPVASLGWDIKLNPGKPNSHRRHQFHDLGVGISGKSLSGKAAFSSKGKIGARQIFSTGKAVAASYLLSQLDYVSIDRVRTGTEDCHSLIVSLPLYPLRNFTSIPVKLTTFHSRRFNRVLSKNNLQYIFKQP